MRCRLLFPLLALALCLQTSAQAEFTPIAGWDKQLFPSFLIGTAALKDDGVAMAANELGDTNGLLGVAVVAPHDNAKIEVTIECNQFAEPSRYVGVLEKGGETYAILPKMKYKFDSLSQCSQATPASVTYRVAIDGKDIEEKSTTITFRSINDCPLKVVLGDNVIDTSLTVAAYVNEQHPFIDKLLREALDIGNVEAFDGYQGGTDESVLAQVYAVWDLLVARDTRYSSITTTVAESDIIASQNIRTIEHTINNQQANCIDGSILLVSILRKIDIEAKLILVPGHCYIGFYLDEAHTKFVALETTRMGAIVDEPEEVDELLESAIDESLRDEYSWPSFVEAIEIGMSNFAQAKEKFESQSEPDYKIVDIGAARKIGILPIPHRSKEVFVQFDHSEDSEEWSDESDESEDEDEDE